MESESSPIYISATGFAVNFMHVAHIWTAYNYNEVYLCFGAAKRSAAHIFTGEEALKIWEAYKQWAKEQ